LGIERIKESLFGCVVLLKVDNVLGYKGPLVLTFANLSRLHVSVLHGTIGESESIHADIASQRSDPFICIHCISTIGIAEHELIFEVPTLQIVVHV
jgi:hypothetical protein